MNDQTAETWLSIPGFDGYEASDLGRIRSVERTEVIGDSQRIRGARIMKIDGGRVRLCIDGNATSVNVKETHRRLFPHLAMAGLSNPNEMWLAVPRYEGLYEISNQGRVRSTGMDNVKPAGVARQDKVKAPRILKSFLTNGYLTVHLLRQPDGAVRQTLLYVEALMENLFPDFVSNAEKVVDEPGEAWLPIRGYEELYEVSNLGRVKSFARWVNGSKRRFARERLRITGDLPNGYPKVELARKGTIKTVMVHRLVADAFVPNPHGFDCVHHIDEDKRNARAENLEWITRAANVQDWYDRRRVTVSTKTIETIAAALSEGKSPAEILAALPRKRKGE